MHKLVLSVLALAAMGIASSATGAAHAQKNGTASLSNGPDIAGIDNVRRIEENKKRALEVPRKAGLAALQAQDFAGAEKEFAQLLSFDPTTSDANYLMGLTQIGLKNWPSAKSYLELAVQNEPKRPEPKARLGIAYIMTGDIAAADSQRTALLMLADKCNGCADTKKISDNVAMLEKVLAAARPKTTTQAPAPPLSAPLPEG